MARDMRRLGRHAAPLAALVTSAVLILAGCGSTTTQTLDSASGQTLFGPFAGYFWIGQVQQVSAVVVVPAVIAGSQPGTAGTWIGAQGPTDPKTLYSPFFQVGVNEARLKPSHGVPGAVGYYGFWSSTGRGFHPVFLFNAYPGDRVRLVMTLTRNRWLISADDETQRVIKTFAVANPRGATYDQAIWQQEDVSDDSGYELPYPEVSPPVFLQLKVNALAPRAPSLTTTWMSTRTGVFGPSRLLSDRFVVREVHPSPSALRYQEISAEEYLPAITFSDDATRWTAHTARRTIKTDCVKYAEALQRSVSSLRAYKWPAEIKVLTGKLGAAIATSRRAVLTLSRTPASQMAKVGITLRQPDLEAQKFADEIRKRLKVPRVDPSGLLVDQYIRAHAG
jgi:hypothetical protein